MLSRQYYLALEKAIRTASVKAEIFGPGGPKLILAFADDIGAVGCTVNVKENFIKIEEEAQRIGLRVNEGKTKYMHVSRKSGRLRWAGHLQRSQNDRLIKRVWEEAPIGKRPLGRPRLRWRDNIIKDVVTLDVDRPARMEGDDPRPLQVKADSQGSQDPPWVVVLRSSSSSSIRPLEDLEILK